MASSSLRARDFEKLSSFIRKTTGIKLGQQKKTLLESRLHKRLHHLGMGSFDEYCGYVFSPEGIENELVHLINTVTTNKTDFFREYAHFEYLTNAVLPDLVRAHGAGVRRPLAAWSAGCSTGEEPYSMAIIMSEFAKRLTDGFDFIVTGSDISTRVLEKASSGIYAETAMSPVPMELKKKYFLKGKGAKTGFSKICRELRSKVEFRTINLMEDEFGFREELDIIFCRNVIIYFDKDTQERLLKRFCEFLHPGGYLFIGHSDSFSSFSLPLTKIAPSIYRK